MKLLWTTKAWEDYLYWQETDLATVDLINKLFKDVRRDPFKGLGTPEALKYDFQGWWSRRITGEHRFVYRVSGKDDTRQIEIAQCRYHY